jgi:hypothetical protein
MWRHPIVVGMGLLPERAARSGRCAAGPRGQQEGKKGAGMANHYATAAIQHDT